MLLLLCYRKRQTDNETEPCEASVAAADKLPDSTVFNEETVSADQQEVLKLRSEINMQNHQLTAFRPTFVYEQIKKRQ